jgi:5-formyltetrahydrofolate cyclo-ligase
LQKKILREKVLKQRQALTMDEARNFGVQIIQYLIKTISWHHFSIVHLYLSCDQRKEINTQPLLEYL